MHVATKWYKIPTRKMPKVFKAKHTSPHGIILFKQKSINPSQYSNVNINVPPQTNVDPYKTKFRYV